jgi:APA family basic amino acid/polyamine antiporter
VTPPRRQLGLIVTAAIVVANMIGVGVFTSTGFQAQSLGDPPTILLAWVVGGVIALCGAAAYAELGSMMPKAGGEYVYLREAYHPVFGFMSGWVSLTAGFSAPIAAAALAFAKYLATLVPDLQTTAPWAAQAISIGDTKLATISIGPEQAVAMALIVLVTAMHSFDTKVGGWVQAAFTAAKVLLIVLFIIGGILIGDGDWSNLASQHGGFSNVGTSAFAIALLYISLAYSGWNAAAYIAGDVEKPERNLPRALLFGTGLVMALYVLLNLVFLYAVPIEVLAGPPKGMPVIEVGDVAAKQLFGDSAGKLVSSVIALALVSAVSAMIMAGPRVYAAMAENRALPRRLAFHNQRGVPVVAVVTQGVLGCMFVLVGDLGALMRFVSFTLAIFAALAVTAVFVLRARGMRGAYRTFGYPVTPIVFIAASAWIAYAQIEQNPKESAIVGLLLLVGGVVYFLTMRGGPPSPRTPPPPSPAVPEARVVSRPDHGA